MFSNDGVLGVRPSEKYKFLIILSPTGAYFSKAYENTGGGEI